MVIFIVILLMLITTLAIWGFGRFARRAKGQPSYALPIQPNETSLDRILGAEFLQHPNESSLILVSDNLDAFAVRAKSAREAGRSLDLQYYIWNNDLTGQLLCLELLEAADRGVRVRILLDALNSYSSSRLFAILNLHPNIHIRIFNPILSCRNSLLRGIEWVVRAFSINRRMHNKAWIADGRLAIVGGRNIGNEYFDAAEDRNFFDIDLLAGGEAVSETEQIFDSFWNSKVAIPIQALEKTEDNALEQVRQLISQQRQNILALPYIHKLKSTPNVKSLFSNDWHLKPNRRLHWSDKIHVYSDPVSKVLAQDEDKWLYHQLRTQIQSAKNSLILISPYFVPGKKGVEWFKKLREKQVKVDILTNSLATNDVIMAHGGYAPYRKPLLKAGVNLFELKPFGKTPHSLIGSKNASLHTKAFLVDNQIGFVGSFNFDPRSANLNTEMGIIFEEPSLVKALESEFKMKSSFSYSYHIKLEKNKTRWLERSEHHQLKVWKKDPHSAWWQRLICKIVSWLPIESQI